MYKLVISKFEEALIDSEEAISASTIIKIDELRKKGCLFVIFTNDSLKKVLDYNVDFPFIDYIIACDGAYLYDVSKEKIIYKKKIEEKILKEIVTTFSNYRIYGFTERKKMLITDLENKNIYKLEIKCPSKKIATQVVAKLEEFHFNIFCDVKKVHGLFVVGIIMGTVSKSLALEKICSMRKIKFDEVIGIGAEDSDIALLEMVGYKVAMGNASNRLKKVVNEVTSDNTQDGVYQILNRI